MRMKYTKEMDDFILSHKTFPNAVVNEFNTLFNVKKTDSSLYSRKKTLKDRKESLTNHDFSSYELEWVKKEVKNPIYRNDTFDWELFTKAFNEFTGRNKTPKQVKYFLGNHRITVGKHTMSPINVAPIGHEKKFDGEWYVKVSLTKIPKGERNQRNKKLNYQKKTRYMYEKYHNVKLKDNEYIIQLDGNVNNFDKENLFLVDKSVMPCMKHDYWQTNNPKLKKIMLIEATLIKTYRKEKENE